MGTDGVTPAILSREEILKGAEEAFFLAMLDGYAGGDQKKSVKTTSNNGHTTTVVFTHGDYVVKDEWHTNPGSQKSGGSTLITHKGVPVWLMSYQGEYLEGAIPILKEALRSTYEKKEFRGGRGPERYPGKSDDEIRYTNYTSTESTFENFRGSEEILEQMVTGLSFGYHIFSGMALI